MSTKKSIKQILEDAAAYIEKVGWCQDQFYLDDEDDGTQVIPDRPCCVRGAIWAMDPDGHFEGRGRACRALLKHLNRDAEVTIYDLADWNDQITMTKDKVVQALREAAAELPE